jgi:hypothetical protein
MGGEQVATSKTVRGRLSAMNEPIISLGPTSSRWEYGFRLGAELERLFPAQCGEDFALAVTENEWGPLEDPSRILDLAHHHHGGARPSPVRGGAITPAGIANRA